MFEMRTQFKQIKEKSQIIFSFIENKIKNLLRKRKKFGENLKYNSKKLEIRVYNLQYL